jgi:diadenosine tetraphosphate (Ap4A) HIT family hydrolase
MRIPLFLLIAAAGWAQTAACLCDHANPATLETRDCSLCKEADKHAGPPVFFLKDNNPRKPNRTLALPVKHGKGQQDLRDLSPAERVELWKTAMAKAQELWPNTWGLAVNSSTVRTQCHFHIHIGKLIEGVDEFPGRTVSGPEHFPVPEPGLGVWVHPIQGGYHVHVDREIAEPVLVR